MRKRQRQVGRGSKRWAHSSQGTPCPLPAWLACSHHRRAATRAGKGTTPTATSLLPLPSAAVADHGIIFGQLGPAVPTLSPANLLSVGCEEHKRPWLCKLCSVVLRASSCHKSKAKPHSSCCERCGSVPAQSRPEAGGRSRAVCPVLCSACRLAVLCLGDPVPACVPRMVASA